MLQRSMLLKFFKIYFLKARRRFSYLFKHVPFNCCLSYISVVFDWLSLFRWKTMVYKNRDIKLVFRYKNRILESGPVQFAFCLPSGPWARWQIFPENDKIFLFENKRNENSIEIFWGDRTKNFTVPFATQFRQKSKKTKWKSALG